MKIEDTYEVFLSAAKKQLRFLDKAKINLLELPKDPVQTLQLFQYGATNTKCIVIEEYADYCELVRVDNLNLVAEKLGFAAGSLFNSLANNAMRKYGWGVCIVDPLVNNMKFNCVLNDGPSVSDPEGIVLGWASFRLKFGAGA